MNQDENAPWQYKPDDAKAPSPSAPASGQDAPPAKRPASKAVAWEASEYIEHQHGIQWYALLAIATIVLAVIVYFASRDVVATGIIVIVGTIVGAFARQKPALAKYEISSSGLSINGKLYSYANYKSFAIMREGPLTSVNLFPLKRFLPPVSAYFDPADEPRIVEVLGSYLPYEERQLDPVDRLSRRLRL